MRTISFNTALAGFRLLFVAYIVWASARTLLRASHGDFGPSHAHFVYVLAGIEIIAAVGLLWSAIEPAAAVLLGLVFVVAAAHELVDGSFPAHLFFYAGTLAFLMYLRHLPGHDRPIAG